MPKCLDRLLLYRNFFVLCCCAPTAFVLCPNRFCAVPQPLLCCAPTAFVLCPNRFCAVPQPLLCCAPTAFVLCPNRFCAVPQPLLCCAPTAFVLCPNRFCAVLQPLLCCAPTAFVLCPNRFCAVLQPLLCCASTAFVLCFNCITVPRLTPDIPRAVIPKRCRGAHSRQQCPEAPFHSFVQIETLCVARIVVHILVTSPVCFFAQRQTQIATHFVLGIRRVRVFSRTSA